uniref:Uncharacterized protein n=1 Tax=Arundo donax TaxID=35708 RepID=A0A0A9A1N2_ARUDO
MVKTCHKSALTVYS